MVIRARAPLRISFAGGGTDISPYTDDYGGAVLNATIDMYAYASLHERSDNGYEICNLDDQTRERGSIDDIFESEGSARMAKAVVKCLGVDRGFTLKLHSDAAWGTGLGSSSTHIVAVIGAFARLLAKSYTDYEIAELAYQLERIEIGLAGGRQDQYSAVFGGINFIEFGPMGVVVNPLRVKADVLNELHYRAVLCSVGRSRNSSRIIDDQVQRYKSGDGSSLEALHRTRELAYAMKDALLTGQIDTMAELLHEGWLQKRRFSDLVSTPEIEELYEFSRRHGAIGGKVIGAGGGGHMLFICSESKVDLTKQLAARGIQSVGFTFEASGLTSWEG